MKNAVGLLVVVLATLMSSLVGCEKSEFGMIGNPQVDGDKVLTAWVAKDRDTWGVNNSTIMIRETERRDPRCEPRYDQRYDPRNDPRYESRSEPRYDPRERYFVWVPDERAVACERPAPPVYQCERPALPKSRAINFSNVGGNGVWTGFFEEGFAGLAQGAGTAVTGFGFRPSRISMRGGNATGGSGGSGGDASSASSSASAAP